VNEVAGLAWLALSSAAEPAVRFEAIYTADLIAPLRGAPRAGRYLDNLDLVLDLDLERAVGWRGGRLHAYGLNNSGGQPNATLGTLQGVDNIEVGRARGRLYELWLEQRVGPRATVLAGLYDLNSEFYVTEASSELLGPSFGIGPELSATGSNGPSIFPSTALTVRVRAELGGSGYVQAAALNADAGVPGDPGGVRGFDNGFLVIAEAGAGERTRLALGAWRYTESVPDLRAVRPSGEPSGATAQGVYALAEHKVDAGGRFGLFLRAGLSDGDSGPFQGAWQAGVRVAPAFASRPDSVLAVGAHQGRISRKYRRNAADAGEDVGPAESGLEITYADRIHSRVTLQPDFQYIRRPGGRREARDEIVAGLRVIIDLSPRTPEARSEAP
jgi:porin